MSQAITPFLTDITHFHRDTPDGEYDLTFYPILPGVILALNEIHTTVVPSAPGRCLTSASSSTTAWQAAASSPSARITTATSTAASPA